MNLNVNMDTVMNKLRNTVTSVTSTVSQLSAVLPGNPVTREFEATQHIGSGGPGMLWKIYSGFKNSTKQEAAIFVFEKKQLDKWSKKDREAMLEILRKGVSQLTRLKHPRILTVQHPLEESRDSLAFATEPVFASLANVLGDYTNMPEDNEAVRSYKLHDIEIKYGLLQVCEGLKFLHNDAKILHGNLCPEAVIITKQNSWKISGLEFCANGTANNKEVSWPSRSYDSDANPLSQPHLDFIAPEITTSMSFSPSSDMFSLGMLTFTCFNLGKPIFCNRGDWNRHRQNIIAYNQLPESKVLEVPRELRQFCRKLLSFTPQDRPDAHEFSKLEFLYDEGVKTLNYLDSIFQWDNLQKSKFYKGLSEILPGLPHRVRLLRVVPCLAQEFVNPAMVPFVLPNVLKIAEWSTNEEYVHHILPYLRDVMKLREPVQVLFIFMKYMELLLQKTPPEITKTDVLPLIYGSLESDSPQVQELCLSIIPSFAGLIDYPAMKNSLLPRIRKLVVNTQSLSVRVNCLVCLGKILDHLDKWMVIDYILPFLTEISSRDPAVVMGIVGIYKLAVNHKKLGVSKEIIATKILPFIFPLTMENGLTTQQFSTIMSFIYDMIKTVETEQKAKLEELGAIAQEREKMKAELNSHPIFSNNSTSNNVLSDLEFKESPKREVSLPSGSALRPSSSVMPSQALSACHISSPPSVNTSHSSKPPDLMSSLINSNLSQIGGIPSFTQPVQPVGGLMKTSNSVPMGINLNTKPNGIQNTLGFNNPSSNLQGLPGYNQFSSMLPTNSAMPTPSMGNGTYQPTFNSQPNSFNLQQSFQPVQPALKTDNVKSLSKRDIDDLLS